MSLTRMIGLPMLLVAAPLLGVVRHRAITSLPTVTLSGVVRDATTGGPVPGAIVSSGSSFSNRNGTGPDGKYSLTLPANRPTVITIEDFAYETQAFVYTPAAGVAQDFVLSTRRPAATVRLATGETYVLDLGTSQFGYLISLSGFARFDSASFCKPDGSAFNPAKMEIARIIGPGVSVTFSGCCTLGPVLTLNVEMKSGEKTAVYFKDSCVGYDVFFIGREPATGEWRYLNFKNIAEIDFP